MDKNQRNLLNKIRHVPGYLRDDEAWLLFQLAQQSTGKGVIVEIGSWKGKSTICLALGSKQEPKSPVYAIDPHVGSSEHQRTFGPISTLKAFKKNIKKAEVASLVKMLVISSRKAAQNFSHPVELIFIDGDHNYQAVKRDFLDWSPHLVDGGIIAFHDTFSWPGPKKVVDKYLFKSAQFKNIRVIGSITFTRKTEHILLLDKILNRYVLFLKRFRENILKIKLPQPIHQMAKRIYYWIQ